jgi:hypothetical protein
MDETPELDWLDRQLREAAPYIDDAGFTRRVLQSLPALQPRLQLMRASVLLGATLIASVVAYFLSGEGRFVVEGIMRLAGLSPVMLLTVTVSASVLIMTGGIVAAARTGDVLRR